MIQVIRIDDRLLHGQVAYSWKAFYNYQAIVIADDNVANDEFRKSIIKTAAPNGVKVTIKSIEQSLNLLKNPKLNEVKVFVVVSNPKSAYEIMSKLDNLTTLNLGGMMNKEGTKEFSKAVFMDKEDIRYMDMINDLGVEIDIRQTPNESKRDYCKLRKNFI